MESSKFIGYDIVDTFIDMKQITDSYGVQLLNNKTADSLLQFIISNCYVKRR